MFELLNLIQAVDGVNIQNVFDVQNRRETIIRSLCKIYI